MKNFNFVKPISLLVFFGASSLPLMGFSSASQSIILSAEVPLACRVSFAGASGQFDTNGVAELGTSQEFCNSPHGYKVYARAKNVDDGASLLVNGQRFNITNGQEFLIVNSSGPAILSRAIGLDSGNGAGGGTLSLRIEAN